MVIGGRHETSPDDPAGNVVVPGLEGGGLAICPVPERRTVKHRVHLDVYTAAIADLEALGATVLTPAEESGLGWTVMADPEGGEFCAFLREPDQLPGLPAARGGRRLRRPRAHRPLVGGPVRVSPRPSTHGVLVARPGSPTTRC